MILRRHFSLKRIITTVLLLVFAASVFTACNNAVKTEEKTTSVEPVYCSFCGRPNTQVVKMVQGPGVNICSECTMIAVQYLILEDKMPSNEAQKILDIFWSKIK